MPKRHVQKKREKKMHTQIRYATCPQGMSKEKKEMKDKSTSKENKEERWIMQRSSSTLCQKKSTHLHILIRLYDSLLLGSIL